MAEPTHPLGSRCRGYGTPRLTEHDWIDLGDGPFCDRCDVDKTDAAGVACVLPLDRPTGRQVLTHYGDGGTAEWRDATGAWVPLDDRVLLVITAPTEMDARQDRVRLVRAASPSGSPSGEEEQP